jgi:diguanylate cyclase (GGDEF)-like protein
MDIDHFKDINDTYGHQAGDFALKTIADIIMSQIRKSDIACRFGGEEFMIILPETGVESAVQKAGAFLSGISNQVFTFNGKEFHVTVSIGVAVYPVHGTENDQILSKADAALYAAKDAGRNRVIVYSEDNDKK